MLALYIGFSLDLPRPYWAMLTVYITVQPLSGALRSKAFYRVLGTSLGGVAAVALVPNLVDRPLLLSFALALWVGICLYLSLLDRTPRSYIFLLAGYTAAIIGFPSVNAPGAIFDTALARVEEITLGILCATFVHTILFPRSVLGALNARIAAIMKDAQGWASESWAPEALKGDALTGIPQGALDRERRRIAADITELHILSTHLPFDTANVTPRIQAVRALRDRLALLLPLGSAVEDRRRALASLGRTPSALTSLLSDVRTWIVSGGHGARERAVALQQACAAAEPELHPASDWGDLLTASLLGRLAELIDAVQDARELARHIRSPERPLPPALTERLVGRIRRPLHRDHGLALLSGVAVFVAILVCCAGWIATAWPEGSIAPLSAAIFGSFFAAQDDPAPSIRNFLKFSIVSFPIAALYMFAVLPAIDGFPMLVMTLAPVFLVLGYFQGQPKTFGIAIALILGVAGALSLQAVFSADFAGFVNNFVAQIIGIAAALVATELLRSIGADLSARRILRFGWRDLAANAAAPAEKVADRGVWTSRMLDRVGLLVPRLALAERREELVGADPLNDLRVGLNIIDLQQARGLVGPVAEQSLVRLLGDVAAHFRKLAVGRIRPYPASLLTEIDRAIADVAHARPSPERRSCLWSLAGLRRNLFPDAPAYLPKPVSERAA